MLHNLDPDHVPRDVVGSGEYCATYGGWMVCWLRPFWTKRRHQRVKLYRWTLRSGEVVGPSNGYSATYLLGSARFDRRFRNVMPVSHLESV